MATIDPKFILKGQTKKGKSLILLQAYYKRKRFLFSTDQKINPDHWNIELQEAITGYKKNEELNKANKAINAQLEKIRLKFNDLIIDFERKKTKVDYKFLKNEMEKEFRPEIKSITSDFYSFMDNYIEKSKANKAIKTVNGYTYTYNHIKEFDSGRGVKTNFQNINLDWHSDFTQYLKTKNHSPNNIGKHIKNVKVFLNAAKDRLIEVNPETANSQFKVTMEKTDKIYLTENELLELVNNDFSKIPRLETVRDLFIIAAYTSLRYSDFTELKQANILINQNGQYIKLRQKKTGDNVEIPLHPFVDLILKKYNYSLPSISNQKFNTYIKEVAKAAKLNREVIIRETRGSLTSDKVYKVSDKISSHTGRRSGATNMYKAGIPEHTIMKITGHKTVQAFEAYLCLDNTEHLEIMQKNIFFNPSQSLKAI